MFRRPETPLWSPSLSKDAKIQLVWGSSLTQIWISILSYCPHNDWKINYKGHQRYSLHNMHCLKKDFMVEPHRHEHIEAICLPLWAHAANRALKCSFQKKDKNIKGKCSSISSRSTIMRQPKVLKKHEEPKIKDRRKLGDMQPPVKLFNFFSQVILWHKVYLTSCCFSKMFPSNPSSMQQSLHLAKLLWFQRSPNIQTIF